MILQTICWSFGLQLKTTQVFFEGGMNRLTRLLKSNIIFPFSLTGLIFVTLASEAGYNSPNSKLLFGEQQLNVHLLGPVQGAKSTLIVLGGGPSFSSWNLEPIQQRFAQQGYRVGLMDMAGIGENSHLPTDSLLEIWIQQIKLVKDNIQPKTPITLVGHSWGGLMALLYLREYPDDVSKVILLNPVDPDKKAMQNLTAEIDLRNRQEAPVSWDDESLWEQKTDISDDEVERITLRQIQQVLPTYFLDYEQGKRYAEQFSTNDFDIDLNVQAWKEYDANPIKYQEVEGKAEFYFLECEQDYLMPYNKLAFEQGLQFNRIEVIDGCGHFPWVEQEAVFYKLMEDFLNE
jgi:pimeloyl-ACP methyl ester carboxylesterase